MKKRSWPSLSNCAGAEKAESNEMIVLDANILIRAILGRRVRQLIDTYASLGVRFFALDVAFDDAGRYLPLILKRRGKPLIDISVVLEYLKNLIEPVTLELYAVFESEARQRLRGRDESDWPILATALALACPIWTEDADFFGTGVATWTTNRIEIFLQGQTRSLESEEE
jgi:predicted nucleic acid-binding protein